jgi:multidrug transporter EmrE-like cation transporter
MNKSSEEAEKSNPPASSGSTSFFFRANDCPCIFIRIPKISTANAYRGTLIDGKVFDDSFARKRPEIFKVKEVIEGWQEALKAMPVGSRWIVYIPYELGYGMLYKGDSGETLSLIGMLLVILSSLSYAIYIVGVNHSTLKTMSTAKLTFYALLFGLSIYVVRLNFMTDLQAVPSFPAWVNILAMAFLPTVISLICTAISIHSIGSTPTAILGALEPVTALFFGVMIFGERLTPRLVLGILMILVAVTFIVVGKSVVGHINHLFLHLLRRH